MAQDDDRFELRPGHPRSDGGRAPKGLRAEILPRLARAGGNPRHLHSVVQQARTPKTGRFNARGRGAKFAASVPRGSGWSFDRGSGMRVRPRRVTVKVRIVKVSGKAGGVQAHLHYLERDGVTRDGEPGLLYSTFADNVDRDAFVERGQGDRHQFRIILAPEDGAAYEDLKPFTRDVMAKMEADLGTTLDWVAADHHDTGHPHAHVVVRGVTEDGKILNIAGDYIAYGIRHRASELLTRDLGPQTEREVERQLENEVEAERLTRLDRTLIERVEDGRIDLHVDPSTTDFGRAHHQLLIARARRLERMGLAAPKGPLVWSLSAEMESVLRTMGERGDIIKTMHRAMTEAGLERLPQYYLVHDRDSAPVIGHVVARGLADEMGDRRYLVLDGIDGRSHYVDIGEAEGSFPIGSILRVSNTSTEPRQVDRTVAEIAAAHDGQYSVDLHLFHDPTATDSFAQTHVRRLEVIRRATGAVERDVDGTWIIKPDHLDRVRAYERQLAQTRPVAIDTLSNLSVEQQIGADAPTWLDRQIVHAETHALASHGFGRDVHSAMVRRQQWLIEQKLMERDGHEVVYRTDILDQLRRRELRHLGGQLSAEIGLPYAESVRGERVEGLLRRSVETASGRYALVERSHEFTLVPWKPMLERHIDRYISGIDRGDSIDWTIGRQRGGPSL
ncbi:relaxase/mobilization nuclease RlxS [Telmatospirillum sp.]|uniref:relaxase/mobilization nuclease RlxS n=1 Tax=Telmatospirillum sp. TaxID=2079197 RepID=UPI0028517BA0|nr:relaxase/mobilization nuclease RlxS [Telmatospirillum sp.]MDR3438794.1 relaxase/mobilization nuclease RlxS [Telmatospirillum sp.]